MSKVVFTLQSARFTKTKEVVREVKAFLEAYPDWKLQLQIPESKAEEYMAEIGEWRTLGRVKVVFENGTQEELFQ
jgi:hypothetical protein